MARPLVLIVRDQRGAPSALHRIPRGRYMPYVVPDTQEIFYSIGSSPLSIATTQVLVPARDVIHFRQYCPRHPLVGESPIAAAALACGINVALSQTQAAFFSNMARPSGILSTDQALSKEQMDRLRAAFKEQSAGWSRGELPILANGLKFQALAVNSVDAQLIDSQRMSVEDIARAYGVPLPLIGDLSKATLNNTESLINLWLSMALGSTLENVERSFEKAFAFGPSDVIELDTAALLRVDMLQRIDALTKGVQGGLYTPNEARAIEGLNPADDGDEPMMQVQMAPLSILADGPAVAARGTPASSSAAMNDDGDGADSEGASESASDGEDDAAPAAGKGAPMLELDYRRGADTPAYCHHHGGPSCRLSVKRLLPNPWRR